ncbi:MAG: hypothetical protein WA987_15295 [Cellvibrio sp.]|jgi:hypothetical protein
MRALAEFIMRGRTQAAVVAVLGTAVPVLTPATIALVSLRKGISNGFLILLWGLLPMLISLAMGQMQPLMPILAISGFVVTYLSALILRNSMSWAYTLMGLVALSILTALLQLILVPDLLARLMDSLAEFVKQLFSEMEPSAVTMPGQAFVVGMIAYVTALGSLFGLIVGRWWQASLYNPGGFAEEFQQFRLNTVQAVVCMAAAIYCLTQSPDYRTWATLFVLPLLVMGVAIVHRLVAVKRMGTQWLVGFYVLVFLLDVIAQLLVIVAFLDTWLNFRGRFKPKL